ncbi:MAG: type II toxin-antitoxin system VapB family antitoxin [Gammaproteobacteria bacterium]|nr:type II toxin-antitoxin system VapB family antitoxin [Gammaproteobacteria bacterium]
MGPNIKNEETCRLASQLARLTGETKTGAITVALPANRGEGAPRLVRVSSAPLRNAVPVSWARDRPPWSMEICSTTSGACRSDRRQLGASRRSPTNQRMHPSLPVIRDLPCCGSTGWP